MSPYLQPNHPKILDQWEELNYKLFLLPSLPEKQNKKIKDQNQKWT